MEGRWHVLVKRRGLRHWLLFFLLNPKAHLLYLLNMRYLLTALLLLPVLVSAQELHTFRNGEVADADKVNQNFDALKDQLLLQTHPEGDLFFRYSDQATVVTPRDASALEQDSEEIALDLEDGSSWGPIFQNRISPHIYSQQGISFERHLVSRQYPPVVAPPDVCPEDTVIAIPFEILETYFNQYGSITQGTTWDFGDTGSPSPDAIANNSAGMYVCLGAAIVTAGSLSIKGATGRYKCASSSGELFFAAPAVEGTLAELPAIEGLSTASFAVDYFFGQAFISADIPATCEETESRSSIAPPSSKVMTVFGIEVEVPPIQ